MLLKNKKLILLVLFLIFFSSVFYINKIWAITSSGTVLDQSQRVDLKTAIEPTARVNIFRSAVGALYKIFVPTKTLKEWNLFKASPPPGVVICSTITPANSSFASGTCNWGCNADYTLVNGVCVHCGYGVEYAGITYPTAQIGIQCWMTKNLNVGTRISGASNSNMTNCATTADIKKSCYADSDANCTTYGAMYSWGQSMCGTTIEGTKGICPDGWHIPTNEEQGVLETYLTTSGECDPLRASGTDSCSGAGTAMKTGSFSGLLPGRYASSVYAWLYSYGYYASSSQYDSTNAWYRRLSLGGTGVIRANYLKTALITVRCIRDIPDTCEENDGVYVSNFESQACTIANGTGMQYKGYTCNNGLKTKDVSWSTCTVQTCDYGYTSAGTSCTNNCGDSVVYDGKTYPVAQFGIDCWMTKNLNVGTRIAAVSYPAVTPNCTSAANMKKFCVGNLEAGCTTYGALYPWNQAMCGSTTEGAQGICPSGWHIPSDFELYRLESFLTTSGNKCEDDRDEYSSYGCSGAGTAITNGTFAFAPLSGLTISTVFSSTGFSGFISSSTQYGSTGYTFYRRFTVGQNSSYRDFPDNYDKSSGLSVRCIKNKTCSEANGTYVPNIVGKVCDVANGTAMRYKGYTCNNNLLTWDTNWGDCLVTSCNQNYYKSSNTACSACGSETWTASGNTSASCNACTYSAWDNLICNSSGNWYATRSIVNGNSAACTASATSNNGSCSACTTASCLMCGAPVVYGGILYPTKLLGTQCWMTKNLEVGTRINLCTNGYLGGQCTSGGDTGNNQGTSCSTTAAIQKYCYLDNPANCTSYGGLYQLGQALCGSSSEGVKGICPMGWHVPSDNDYWTLETYFTTSGICDPNREGLSTGSCVGSYAGFMDSNLFKTQKNGKANIYGGYTNNGQYAYFWSSKINGSNSINRWITHNDVVRDYTGDYNAFSVRCVRDY